MDWKEEEEMRVNKSEKEENSGILSVVCIEQQQQ